MRNWFSVFVPAAILAMSVGALAQGTNYKLGRAPTQEEIRAWDISIGPEGKELPPGSGNANEGAKIFAQRCAKCHGPTGEEQLFMGFCCPGGALVRRRGPNNAPDPSWPLATMIFDHIWKAMPRFEEGSLTSSEAYSVTALILYWNGVIQGTDVMDAKSLPKVQMPKRKDYLPGPADAPTPPGR